jgi:hypothetical protein
MAHGWAANDRRCDGGADGVLCHGLFYWRLDMEFTDMTKHDALRILKLLSALESWAFSTKNPLPPFVDNELVATMEVLEKLILEGEA